MLGAIENRVRGHIAQQLRLGVDALRLGANVCEVVDHIISDVFRVQQLAWDNRGMVKNLPPAFINTIGHLSGSRAIDYSVKPDAPNVMMHPGILSGVRSYYPLLEELKTHQINIIESPHQPSYLKALFNIEAAQETAEKGIDVIYNSEIQGLINLLSHSQGVIVAGIMIGLDEERPGPNRIGKVINIAGPHLGTDLVKIFYLNKLLAILGDMDPRSSAVKQIKKIAHRITSIVAANDSFILPEQQRLEGAQKEIELDIDHLDVAFGSEKDTRQLGCIIAEELYAA